MTTATKINVTALARPEPNYAWSWLQDLLPGCWTKLDRYSVGVVTVTPAAAAKILEDHHGSNRPVMKTNVAKIMRDLVDGAFMLNGETIIFDDGGCLRQGQHRMVACRDSGVEFQTFAVAGVPSVCWSSLDQVNPRYASQVLASMKVKAPNEIAAGVRCLAQFCATGVLQRPRANAMSLHQVLDWFGAHPQVTHSGLVAQAYGKNKRLFKGGNFVCALHYVFSRVDRSLADRFFDAIASRSIPDSPDWSGVKLLAERLQADAVGNREFSATEITALTIKAWNALYENRHLRLLLLRTNEEYPRVSGLTYDDGKPVLTGGYGRNG